jgi:signal transduction histidine kinase
MNSTMRSFDHLSDEQLFDELRRRRLQRWLCAEPDANKELMDLADRLRAAEETKTYFLSCIRNELNNPLSSILGLSKMIAQGEALPPERMRAMAALIHNDAFTLDFQIRNIIAAADFESRGSAPRVASVDVAALARDVITQWADRAARAGAEVKLIAHQANVCMESDPALLQLVLSNLLANAIIFGGSRNWIEVHVGIHATNEVRITVKDQGPGINAEDRQRLFTRFGQLDSGRTKQHPGHGLGLVIVRACTEALGGTIELESEPGAGTTCHVVLPPFNAGGAVPGVAFGDNTILYGDTELF